MSPRVTLDLSAHASGLNVKIDHSGSALVVYFYISTASSCVQIQCYTRSHTLTITYQLAKRNSDPYTTLITFDLMRAIATGLISLLLSALLNSPEFLFSELSADKSWPREISFIVRARNVVI